MLAHIFRDFVREICLRVREILCMHAHKTFHAMMEDKTNTMYKVTYRYECVTNTRADNTNCSTCLDSVEITGYCITLNFRET